MTSISISVGCHSTGLGLSLPPAALVTGSVRNSLLGLITPWEAAEKSPYVVTTEEKPIDIWICEGIVFYLILTLICAAGGVYDFQNFEEV
jgi:hypothetical protein